MSLASLVYAYLVGGVTFIPLLVLAFVYAHPTSRKTPPDLDPWRAGESEESAQTGLDCFKKGWIFVTHEDLESQDEISAKTESVGDSQDVRSAYLSLYKLVTNTRKTVSQGNSSAAIDGPGVSNGENSGGIGAGPGLESFGSPIPPSKTAAAAKKHRYYAVLKHGNLFLYKNENLRDVKHVIVLSNHVVSLWPRSVLEASLYTKYSSIAILRNDWSRPRRLSDTFCGSGWTSDARIGIRDVLHRDSGLAAPPGTIFVYTDLNIDKEDWYFALIRATKTESPGPLELDPNVHAKTMHLDTKSTIALIQTLYGTEGQLQSKWLNAIIGRVFLSLQRTQLMTDYLTHKIERKLNKLKTPGFLDKFQITRVDAGHAAPTISFPVLKEISPDGGLLVAFNVHYAGGVSLQLATKVNISLGLRFKTREVDVLLSITLEKILGPMLIKIKPPPSTRIWYTYEREPEMSLRIEPEISSRQMSYNIITNTIEKKFKDAIRDSLMLPHWDDLSFCHTTEELYRGGIWERPAPSAPKKMDTKEEVRSGDSDLVPPSDIASDAVSVETTLLESTTASKTTTIAAEFDDIGTGLSETEPVKSQKAKVTKTISDLSRRLRKPKSAHTLGVDETSCLADGSVIEAPKKLPVSSTSADGQSPKSGSPKNDTSLNVSTLRKLGEWYLKSDKAGGWVGPSYSGAHPLSSSTPGYHPPEMITNRRSRKQSSATINSDIEERATDGSLYDFGQELSESMPLQRSIDFVNSQSVKTAPPKFPPRGIKVSEETGSVSISVTASDAPADVSENEIAEEYTEQCESYPASVPDSGILSNTLSDTVSNTRSNTMVGRKPPPGTGDDDPEHVKNTISTAPL